MLDKARELIELAEKATVKPWSGPCFATGCCDHRDILCEGYCGSVAHISLDNGKYVTDGGNDSPPEEEAAANGLFIAFARNNSPSMARLLIEAHEILTHICHTCGFGGFARDGYNKCEENALCDKRLWLKEMEEK